MIRQFAVRAALVAVTTIMPLSTFAATPNANVPTATSLKVKGGVKITLKNASGAARTLRVGDTTVTLQANEEMAIQVPANTEVIAVGDGGKHKDGDKIVTVTNKMSGYTIAFS